MSFDQSSKETLDDSGDRELSHLTRRAVLGDSGFDDVVQLEVYLSQ